MAHIRFHLSLAELENRLKYVFKDKSLLHVSLYLYLRYSSIHISRTFITCMNLLFKETVILFILTQKNLYYLESMVERTLNQE